MDLFFSFFAFAETVSAAGAEEESDGSEGEGGRDRVFSVRRERSRRHSPRSCGFFGFLAGEYQSLPSVHKSEE